MPASDTQVAQQGGRAPVILFWSGVALAPIAALLLLVGGNAPLRGAVALMIGSVVLVGLSITQRREGETLRLDLEDMVFDEVDAARADMRDDIAHAAQTTHRAFGEKLQYLLEQLEATRGELEALRHAGPAGGQQGAPRHRGNGAGPIPAPSAMAGGQHHEPGAAGSPAGQPFGPSVGPSQGQDAHRIPRSGPPGMGRVRHTETVKVTTRHTVVDPHDEPRGTVYSTAHHDAAPQDGPRHGTVPRPETEREHDRAPYSTGHADSWTEQRLREQMSRRRDSDDGQRWPDRDWEGDDRRPGVRAGDRWANVRSDEHGRELRMGERRASMHADGGGAELRIEDRWAAVRRAERLDEPYPGFPWRDQGDDRRDQGDDRRDQGDDRRDQGDDRRDRGDDRRPAITGSDRAERWSDYDRDRDRDRERDRERDRDRRRY